MVDPHRRADGPADDVTATILDALFEHLPAMVFLKRASDLTFVRFNRAGEDLLGVPRESFIGRSDHDFFPREQADFFVAKDREVLKNRRLVDIPEEPIETPHGRRWLHTRKIPLMGPDGEPTHLLGISIDITEKRAGMALLMASHAQLEEAIQARMAELTAVLGQKNRAEAALQKTEEQLRHSQKMEAVGRLAGGIAHDFNNILSVILTSSELAMEHMAPDDPAQVELGEIHRAGRRANDLTRQLLAFSRRQVLLPRVLDLGQVVRSMERMLKRLLGEDVDLVVRQAGPLGRVLADPSQVEQVLMNLAVNARDAMPSGGQLTIELREIELDQLYTVTHHGAKVGRYVMLAVSDTGHGMDKATIERIFEPFFSTKEPGKGTGLGLSTVHGIVEQSGGSIWVYSEPGRGSTFKVYLPVLDGGEAGERDVKITALPRGRGESILVVEDDEAVRKVAAIILEQQGYRVMTAGSAAEALTLVEQHEVALMVTDVVLPGLGGRLLAEAVRAKHPGTKVLFMSGYTDDAVVRHGVLESGMPFIQKPITPRTLAERVSQVLSGQ
jgi:PAS domain S-box-containing protein